MKLNTKSLKDVEVGFPLLADGTYFCKVLKKGIEPNAAKTGNNLVLQVQILDDSLVTHEGNKIENRGQVKLTRYIGLVPTDKYDPDTAIKELALAAGRPKDDEADFSIEDIADFMKVKLSHRKAGLDRTGVNREASTDVGRFSLITPDDNFTPPAI